jgi:hypothetical protein
MSSDQRRRCGERKERMRVFWTLAAILLVGASSARADIAWSAGDLVCDGGVALARFTKGYNDDTPQYEKLPAEVDRANLSGAPGADRRDCTLSNGWTVRLRLGTDQGFPYGMGGAAPPEYFSLWVNHRKVISRRTWAEGYEQSFEDRNRIVGVLVTAGSVTICKRVDASVVCDREPVTIARMTPDQFEYPPLGIVIPKPGSIKIVVGNGNRLCRAMVRTGRPGETSSPGSVWGFPLNAREVDTTEVSWIDPSPMKPIDTYSWPSMENGRVGQLDLENDRRSETVIIFSGGSGIFDGSYWIVIEQGVSLADVQSEIFPAKGEKDRARAAGEIRKRWHVHAGGTDQLYPGVSTSYVHLDGYTYRGAVYFLAHPTRLTHDPTAVLVRPRANGRMETVCRFQVIRPNF